MDKKERWTHSPHLPTTTSRGIFAPAYLLRLLFITRLGGLFSSHCFATGKKKHRRKALAVDLSVQPVRTFINSYVLQAFRKLGIGDFSRPHFIHQALLGSVIPALPNLRLRPSVLFHFVLYVTFSVNSGAFRPLEPVIYDRLSILTLPGPLFSLYGGWEHFSGREKC